MSYREFGPRDVEARRRARERARRASIRHRWMAVSALVTVIVLIVVGIAVATGGGAKHVTTTVARGHAPSHAHTGSARTSTTTARATGVPGTQSVPILMYHVINPPPNGAPFPGLYVPSDEFTAQMQALKAAGWHAVTMDQLEAYWTRGVSLGAGKPIVISFDNGYQTQYNNALPVLKQLGWVGVENLQLSGLPPSEGGITDTQIRGLIAAGWELDTQGISHADLIALSPTELQYQVQSARQTLHTRYGVPVNWFCYPSGHYNPAVMAVVKSAGFVGSTTVIPGWASPQQDRYTLPRLRVLGGTSPSALLAQIATAQSDRAPPTSYSG